MGKLRSRTKSLFVDTIREKEKLHDEFEEQAEQELDEEFSEAEEIDEGDKEKLFRIFDSILKILPDSDTLSHKQRLARMKWGKVECEDLSPFVVKQKVTSVLNGIRKHRNLKEMLEEALATLTVDDLPELPDVSNFPDVSSVSNVLQPSKKKRTKGLTNGFLIYMKENKPRFVMQHPNLVHSEIMKLVATEYRSLPKKEEEKYKEKARKFNAELLGEAAPPTSKTKKNNRVDEANLLKFKFIKKEAVEAEYPEPRKPYDIFAHRMLLRDSTRSPAELKKQWKGLSGQEKAKFILKALKLSKNSDKSVITKEEQKILNEYEGRPAHPGTAFSEFMSENKHYTMTKIVEMWQNLPDDEKKSRMDRHRETLRNYKSQMAEFLENLSDERRELEKSGKKKSKNSKTPKKDESMDTSQSKKKKKKEPEKTFQMVKVEPEPSTSGSSKKKKKKEAEKTFQMEKAESEASTSGSSRKKMNQKKQAVPDSPEILPDVESPKRKRRASFDSDDFFEDKRPRLSPKKLKAPKVEECVASSSMTNGEPMSKRPKIKKKSMESNGEVKEVKPKKLEPPVQPVGNVYDYYCKFVYKGPRKRMERSWKEVHGSDKKEYLRIIQELHQKYMADLEEYIQSLSPKEMAKFTKQHGKSRGG